MPQILCEAEAAGISIYKDLNKAAAVGCWRSQQEAWMTNEGVCLCGVGGLLRVPWAPWLISFFPHTSKWSWQHKGAVWDPGLSEAPLASLAGWTEALKRLDERDRLWDSTYQHFQVFGAHTHFMRLHFMAHLGIDIWELNPLPSCSRKADMKTSLMRGHVDTSYSSCFVGFGRQEGRGSMCLWSFTPCFLFCYDLGRSVSLAVWYKFQIKLWQWAVPSQGMAFLLFRDPDKHHQGWCAQPFRMTPGLMHDVTSWACDDLWWFLCHISFLSEPKKPSRANQDSKPALPDTSITRDELFLSETPLFLTAHLSPGSKEIMRFFIFTTFCILCNMLVSCMGAIAIWDEKYHHQAHFILYIQCLHLVQMGFREDELQQWKWGYLKNESQWKTAYNACN